MVRETRHLWVGNLPENIREERIREHFKRYGRVQSVKLLPRGSADAAIGGCIAGLGGIAAAAEGTLACTIAFMDIKSASKAHTAEHKLEERTLTTEYYEPAAIPSAAAPQTPERTSAQPVQPPTPYTPTTNNTRFPNTHGSAEEHPGFSERFYERGAGRVADPEYLRRPGYHETSRGRARDRLYRNGPYPPAIIDRGHRTALGTTWSAYEATSTRYSAGASAEAAYVTTPPIVEPERRTSADVQVINKKKTKSRSGSRTPSPSGSTSSRSPSRSRSRSSSSSSSSSTSRGSSSPTSSPRTRSGRIQSAVNAAPPVHSEDRRPLAICVRNLPARSSDTSLKDGLFHEYKKHGKVTWVKVVGQSSDRYALVCFKKPDDVEKALEVSYDKLFFGCKIEVGPYQGYDVEDNEFRPYEAELDEYHPKATRTLFIGNLEKDVTASDLRKHFDQFGEIIEIDIKKQGAVSSYAFCQYSDIVSVVKAIRKMDGEHLGNNRIKLGFGKSMPTNCVWVDGIAERVDEKYLTLQFERYGQVTQASMDRDRGHALIFFEQVSCAQTAVKEMRGINIRGKKLQVDFASRECQDTFFDHLEKQGGGGCERPVFETTRDATQRERSFDSSTLANTNRYTRFVDTPTRPRTSSYSSRSGTGSQCTGSSAVPSPGTPGSVTPRGSGSRSRLTRYPDYYEAGVEYPERRFRSYDEFSQGSAASHEDGYEHEYMYNRESPGGHVEPIESRTMQSVVVATDIQTVGAIFVPPDIRHLQKERVHLLEQLDECPSSGDELMSPKKRLKLDMCDSVNISSELVEINHTGDHRKVIEVRRLSEPGVKHHSRRPSIDGKHCVREVPVERTYLPHAVCKRRKTSGSESDRSRIHHHHDMSGSESLAGSRPGTPLCDERPENLPPSEPRRLPRERNTNDGPLSLPLPRFAAQVLNSPRLNISVAGFKGSKENIVSSPPAIVTSPKISNPVPPSPVHVPPPASPPPRPPSSSNSSDSDAAPPSPSLEERLRSLDEKYEKWSGSRALSAAGGDALAKLDASASERFRFRHKLLDLDLKELQPSEIVKSVLAKRSVFDEDSKRLENVGEKYEPRDFTFPRTFSSMQQTPTTPVGVNTPPTVPASPLLLSPAATQAKSLPGVKAGTPVVSPRAVTAIPAITAIPAAKGLQYPFPSHPPVATGTTAPSPAPVVVTRVTPGNLHSDTRLKLCPSLPPVSADARTNSKVNLNRSGCTAAIVPPPAVSASGGVVVVVANSAVIATTTLPPKLRSLDNKNNGDSDKIINNNLTNIPINISESAVAASAAVMSVPVSTACGTVSSLPDVNHVGKTPPRDKSATRKEDRSNSDNNNSKTTNNKSSSDKVVSRRDSVSSSPSSAGSYKSDTSKKDRRDKKIEKDNSDSDRTVKSISSSSSLSKDNSDIECDRKRVDSDYCDKKAEEEKLNAERERATEKETAERREREEREQLEKERQDQERLEKERLEKERQEKERLEKDRLEKERLEKLEREKQEKIEKERIERERLEKERKREKEEKEKREREDRERREKEEQIERERIEKEKQRKEKEERETREREQVEKERQEKELHEKLQREKQEQRKREKENEKHERRHKEDNHEKKKDDYEKPRQRENHNNTNSTPDTKNRHRENHVDAMKVERHRDSHDSRKENKEHETRTKEVHENVRNNHELQRKDSHDKPKEHHENARNNSELRREEKHSHNNENSKNRHHTERENESKDRRKETPKDISNSHEKNRHFSTESRDNNKDRHSSTESRHLSTESDKSRPYNNDHGLNSTPKRIDANKHKEKNNSTTPASVGCKRRISSQDSSESPDDSKRLKVSLEHKKISDRRDSKDSRDSNKSRSSDTPKQKPHYKSNFTRMLEDKIREEKRNKELSDEKRKEKDRDREHEERYKLKQAQKAEKIKIKSKNRDSKETKECSVVIPVKPCPGKEIMLDKDFLARLDLRANEEELKHRKENKEKRKQENHEMETERRNSDDAKRMDEQRKKEKYIMNEKKIRDENIIKNFEDKMKNPLQIQIKKEGHPQQPQQLSPQQQQLQQSHQLHQQLQHPHPQPQRIRKCTNSSDTSDSDEPKKHSIFDIVDDEPAYISMYDKVKARSCKNMQKQEEEKRQEKLKAKFTQLKQSRAKREEKKRSTSWDEDSDSEHMDSGNRDHDELEDGVGKQNRRGNKMLITSSSEDEHNMLKSRKKSEMYTDSDSDRIRIDKLDRHLDTSDEEHARNKATLVRKTSKSRITSDTSEDEQMRKRLLHQHDKIKKERYSDSDIDHGFADSDEKPDKHYKKLKDEKLNHYDEDKYIKKERKNSKIHPISDDDTTRKMLADAVKLEIYGDKEPEVRLENNKFANSLAMLCDISSEGETIHNNDKKDTFSLEKSEIRKKHKKKQKRQKNNIISEDAIKLERMTDETENECINRSDEPMEKIKTSEKKKHGSKKDKKREKIKDEEHIKEKSKKHRKISKDMSKPDLHQLKREGKLEDIFGSFSDDSETGNKDNILNSHSNKDNNSFFVHLSDKLASNMYTTDSDSGQHVDLEKEKLKEEQRKRKEKKRKEKERRLREENENSVDFADLGKVLEDNLKEEMISENLDKVEPVQIKTEVEEIVVKTEEIHNSSDVFRFSDGDDESPELDKKEVEKKEIKEKKKKRKKSKEEKQNRHHHHHHDKNQEKVDKIKAPDFIKKEPLLIETIKDEPDIKTELQSPSLPNILDIPSPPQVKSSPNNTDFSISPINREPLISPIPKTPTSIKSEKKREKFIPGFGSNIDEKIHENAVKSISDFGSPPLVERIEPDEIKLDKSPKQEKTEVVEDKPRVIISQEETEDAVAALLGESFGGGDFDDCYNETQQSPSNTENNAETTNDEVVVQDDEEMRQAVQSLNSADMEAKPDTPQSEHDLQIDTDTDEGEEIVVRYEQSPRTPDMVDLSRPPKTPDFPTNYYRSDDSATKTPTVVKQTPEPVVQSKPEEKRADVEDVRRNIESSLDKIQLPRIETPRNELPLSVSEPNRTVISGSWSVQKSLDREKESSVQKCKENFVSKPKEDIAAPPKPTVVPLSTQSSIITSAPTVLTSQAYLTPPVIKISEHTMLSTIISPKSELKLSPVKSYACMESKATLIPPLTTVLSKQRSVPQLPTTMPVRVQHAVISHLPVSVAASKPQNPAISQGLLTTVVTSTTVLNRLPITPIMVSKAMQPTAMILPQSKIAVSTIQKLVSTPEISKHEPPRMVYHSSSNMTLPSYSYPTSLTHAQAVPSTFHLPIRTPSPAGLLTHARHVLPPTTYSLPITTRSVSPLVKEVPKSVIEKTVSEHQKISLASHYSQPSYQPPLHVINAEVKPTIAVIQEAPKLVSIPEVRNSQHSIIQQAPPQNDIIRSLSQSISQSISHASMPQLIVTKPVTTIPQLNINHPVISHSIVTKPLASHPLVSLPHVMPPVVSESCFTTSTTTTPQPHLLVSKPVVTKPIMTLPSLVPQPIITPKVVPLTVAPSIITPKLVLPIGVPQKPIISEAPLIKPVQENHCPVSVCQEPLIDIPRVIKETVSIAPRASTSPVIVTPKELSPKVVPEHNKKDESVPVQKDPLIPVEPEKQKEETKLAEPLKLEVQEIKVEPEPIKKDIVVEPITPVTPLTPMAPIIPKPESNEPISVIKETFEKVKQEDNESVLSDPSKEDINTDKDDPLDSKEDSDYWSAKEVNIESVIKKVDALCSADELSEGSELCKEEWYDDHKTPDLEIKTPEKIEKADELDTSEIKTDTETESLDATHEEKELPVRGGRRGGGQIRGRKNNKTERVTTGVTTRRGKTTSTPSRRGGRGGRGRNDKKSKTSESDVYEFHDDSDESKDRPRLILTIKSPAGTSNTPSTPSAVIKEAPKLAEVAPREEFVSPAANTRKSRRIQERDGSRNTIDDIIEDVVRNVPVVTRSVAAAAQGLPSPRRSTRQNVMKVPAAVEPRKSPRATRKKDRRVSETTTDDSSEEKTSKKEELIKPELNEIVVKEEPVKVVVPKLPEKEKPKEIHPMGLKATVLRRVKGDLSEEPMTLIDPVTGLLTQMRECEEGKYIPVSNSSVIIGAKAGSSIDAKVALIKPNCIPTPITTTTISSKVVELSTTTVITKPQPAVPVLQKPQSLKAHVLSSQTAKAVVNQPPTPKVATVQPISQSTFITKPSMPINQNLNINVSVAPTMDSTVLSPRQMVQKPVLPPQPLKPTSSPITPNQIGGISNPKQHFLQAVNKQTPVKQTNTVNPKTHLLNAGNQTIMTSAAQTINATLAHKSHMPQPASLPSPVKQQVVIGNVAPIVKPHNLHVPQQILTGAVASPPLKHHLAQQPIVAGASSGRIAIPGSSPMPGIIAKGAIDPQKVEVSMAGCVMISHPTVSPQAQARGQVLQAGMPVPAYEASLHGVGDHPMFSRQSPPPAHQQTSPAPQGEPMAHFPPGTVPLRNPHDLPPHHFMHTHAVYQSYLRSQQDTRIAYHLPRSPMVSGGLEKTKDGQEGEEAPVTSPPLELRRPGSVGLTARPTAVPHSLQSPHDRATDSPQVAQVYMHQARMPHYHTPGRYYESSEPPPAHRPVTSHTALTGPGSSLGAAGNLIGAMARHTPAEAPTNQRGLQVATPPHASQVPPQADSLLMLLKQYRIMWQGLLALKNDQAAVQMHFVFGNPHVARNSLPCNSDGSTPPLRIAQRMRLEKTQVEGVARKMQMENEHCVLLALPCGRDHMDVLQQSTNLSNGFITYLQQKEAAGIINIAAPGSRHAAYVVHIFPSCDFVKENLARIAPNLLHRVADIAHLLIVIATV